MDKYDNKCRIETRIAMIAEVDHGKSTLISVLSNDILDDGRGSARSSVLQYYHEQQSGRTSSITKTHLVKTSDDIIKSTFILKNKNDNNNDNIHNNKIDNNNDNIYDNKNDDNKNDDNNDKDMINIYDNNDKKNDKNNVGVKNIKDDMKDIGNQTHSVAFIDLCGHKKYFKTTVLGLTSYNIHYAMLLIGSNMGVTKMTKEHLKIAIQLGVPIIVVMTKTDLCPPNVLKDTYKDIKQMLKKTGKYKFQSLISNQDQVDNLINNYEFTFVNHCPIFHVSNKTGQNINLLKNFVKRLSPQYLLHDSSFVFTDDKHYNDKKIIFRVHNNYKVKGVGLVLSGIVISGTIRINQTMYLGPINNKWLKVFVKSIHDDFSNDTLLLRNNETGCIAIRFDDKKLKISRNSMKKGIVLADNEYPLVRKFSALINISTNHTLTIKSGYEPMINCNNIAQTANVIDIEGSTVIRNDDKAKVTFQFSYRSEYLNINDKFIFREGNIRGNGIITDLLL